MNREDADIQIFGAGGTSWVPRGTGLGSFALWCQAFHCHLIGYDCACESLPKTPEVLEQAQ